LLHLLLLLLQPMLYHLPCVHLHQLLTLLWHLLLLYLPLPWLPHLLLLYLPLPWLPHLQQLLQPLHHELPDMPHHKLV
jgi:hypothetical protein